MNGFKKVIKHTHSRVWFILTCVFIPLLLILTIVSIGIIPKVFENLLGTDVSSGRGQSSFAVEGIETKADALAYANNVTRQVCEEGFVLLKNDALGSGEKILPLKTSASDKKKVSVFGKNSVNLVYGGSGSGAADTSKAKTIFDSLTAANYDYNPNLKSFYESSASGSGRPAAESTNAGIIYGRATGETPVSSYDSALQSSFDTYNDLALVVISRMGGESYDLPASMRDTAGAYSANDHYLELDKNEQDMLKMVCEKFEKVVLIINSSQTMELGFLDAAPDGDETVIDYDFASKIKGAVWIGGPGGEGIMALGDILNGTVNPSGRTVDTYARDFTKAPAYANFVVTSEGSSGTSDSYIVGSNKLNDTWYADYEEGIYVGYRYYETRGASTDVTGGEGEEWYNANVVYPFGYGLSYSDFEWEVKSVKVDGSETNKKITENSKIEVTVKVSNTADVAGKDVVQIYVRAPYTVGGIEKADRVLCAFAKTGKVEKGKPQEVVLSFDAYDIASYDTGKVIQGGGYVLESGEYEFLVNRNSHQTVDSFSLNVGSNIHFESNGTETKVSNLFDDVDDQLVQQLTRSDWEGTMPKARTTAERTVDQTFIDKVNSTATNNPLTDDSEVVKKANKKLAGKKDEQNSIKLSEMVGVDYEDPKWEEFLEHLTLNSIMDMTKMAAFGTPAQDYIGKPKIYELDGPVGFTQFMSLLGNEVFDTCNYASKPVLGSTYNVELAEAVGVSAGVESVLGDLKDPYSGWYAPGLNLHRTPFGGRNYEYFSEDAVLTGLMGAAEIKGAWSMGVYTYMKHFVANDSETHRNGVCVWMTEQTLREMYLKPFEIAVKKSDCGERGSGARGVMSSFNRLGSLWTGGDYRLLTQVLRDEWGFKGCVITDFKTGSYMDIKQMAYAGGDLYLNNVPADNWAKKNNDLDVYVAKNAAKHYLYVVANSNAMGGVGADYSTRLADWKIVLIVIDCAAAVGFAVWGFFAVRGALKKFKDADATESVGGGEASDDAPPENG